MLGFAPISTAPIRALEPVLYKLRDSTGTPSGELHMGFSGQALKSLLEANNLNVGLIKEEPIPERFGDGTPTTRIGVRVNEMIAPMISMIKDLDNRITSLEARIAVLEGN